MTWMKVKMILMMQACIQLLLCITSLFLLCSIYLIPTREESDSDYGTSSRKRRAKAVRAKLSMILLLLY
jgi:hypothetical protein